MRKIKSNAELIICPRCGRRFSKVYARATVCGDCPSASFGDCGNVKCPFCSHEFPYRNTSFKFY
ncbi:MAG: hypothetical protein ACTSPY_15150 [Candidatus Helarchaeota archaeon]